VRAAGACRVAEDEDGHVGRTILLSVRRETADPYSERQLKRSRALHPAGTL